MKERRKPGRAQNRAKRSKSSSHGQPASEPAAGGEGVLDFTTRGSAAHSAPQSLAASRSAVWLRLIQQDRAFVAAGTPTDDAALLDFLHRNRLEIRDLLTAAEPALRAAGYPLPADNNEKPRSATWEIAYLKARRGARERDRGLRRTDVILDWLGDREATARLVRAFGETKRRTPLRRQPRESLLRERIESMCALALLDAIRTRFDRMQRLAGGVFVRRNVDGSTTWRDPGNEIAFVRRQLRELLDAQLGLAHRMTVAWKNPLPEMQRACAGARWGNAPLSLEFAANCTSACRACTNWALMVVDQLIDGENRSLAERCSRHAAELRATLGLAEDVIHEAGHRPTAASHGRLTGEDMRDVPPVGPAYARLVAHLQRDRLGVVLWQIARDAKQRHAESFTWSHWTQAVNASRAKEAGSLMLSLGEQLRDACKALLRLVAGAEQQQDRGAGRTSVEGASAPARTEMPPRVRVEGRAIDYLLRNPSAADWPLAELAREICASERSLGKGRAPNLHKARDRLRNASAIERPPALRLDSGDVDAIDKRRPEDEIES